MIGTKNSHAHFLGRAPMVAIVLVAPLFAKPSIFWASDPIRPGETVMAVGDGFGGKPAVEVILPSISVYGNEVRNNVIHGPMPDPRGAGIILGVEVEATDTPSALGSIIEGNEVHDMPVGIRLGKNVSDTRIRSNRYFLRGLGAMEVQRGGPMFR